MSRMTPFAAALAAVVMLSGCVSARFVDRVCEVARQDGVRDAATLPVSGRGYLRFDTALQSDLADAMSAPQADAMRTQGAEVLTAARALAVDAVNNEVRRMSPAAVDRLVKRYQLAPMDADVSAQRTALVERFTARSQALLAHDLARLAATPNQRAARAMLNAIYRKIEPAAGDQGKWGRALVAAPLFIPAAIGAEIADTEATQRAVVANFETARVYRPAEAATPSSAAELGNARTDELARWYAPIWVQQVLPDAAYPADDDRIGQVTLAGTPDDIQVNVEVSEPVVYWTTRQAKVGPRRYVQLIYVAWYPNRPALAANDPQVGRVDGVVVRLTLDQHHRPAVYEFVRSCGCYHTLWVSEFVEAEARAQFGPPAQDQAFAVQKPSDGRELFFPALVADDGARPSRPVVYVDAGQHLLVGIHPADGTTIEGAVTETRPYRLTPYDTLTHLPLGDGVASMFGGDGLVHGAGRREGWLLAPTGMLSAGQPRQLGTMKIRMDAYDYDDPRLLERHLRLPDTF